VKWQRSVDVIFKTLGAPDDRDVKEIDWATLVPDEAARRDLLTIVPRRSAPTA